MFSQKMHYLASDAEAGKILNDFLPERIFDAHAHLFDAASLPGLAARLGDFVCDWERYQAEMCPLLCNPRQLRINAIVYPDKAMADPKSNALEASDAFLLAQLEKCPENVCQIMVRPGDTEADLLCRLTHPGIRGFKCYHSLSGLEYSWNATIDQYLPESAWAVAQQKKMVITLHMVRDHALADPENLQYIRTMAKKYPVTILVLAHCARAFASWTAVECVEKVADLDNVWFDFSAICESPAMVQILRKVGVGRCMWGSDYPICRGRGKAISLGDSFYWISPKDLESFSSPTRTSDYLIGTENLMAVRQAFFLTDLGETAAEDLFWNNAVHLFSR